MKIKSIISVLAAVFAITACGGGGGGHSTGGVYFTHEELAEEFTYRVNVDVAGYDIDLVKTNTEQYDYIVVYDYDYGTYDAYYIGNYNPGENLSSYLNSYDSYFYYDLDYVGGNLYEDPSTGVLFSKGADTSKNLSLKKAVQQDVVIMAAAKNLRENFGLSVEQSVDTARFAYNIKNDPASFSPSHFDAFAKQMTGSTITEFMDAYKAGDSKAIEAKIAKAGEVSKIGSENISKFVGLFTGQGE